MSSTASERLSDSPYVEHVWHGIAAQDGTFTAPADARWELIVKKHAGKTSLVVSGPVTKAVSSSFSAGTEILSIKFKIGTFMPILPFKMLLDARAILPEGASQTFWLQGRAWQFPDFDNADTFIDRLTRDALLVHDPLIHAALNNEPQYWSVHTVRRRFLQATGFTQSTIRQIQRAHLAASLLARGTSIPDTIDRTGFYDQAHLTHAVKKFIGHTPGQIIDLSVLP